MKTILTKEDKLSILNILEERSTSITGDFLCTIANDEIRNRIRVLSLDFNETIVTYFPELAEALAENFIKYGNATATACKARRAYSYYINTFHSLVRNKLHIDEIPSNLQGDKLHAKVCAEVKAMRIRTVKRARVFVRHPEKMSIFV